MGEEKIKVLYIESGTSIRGGGQVSLLEFLRHVDRSEVEPYLLCSLRTPHDLSLLYEAQKAGAKVLTAQMNLSRPFRLAHLASVALKVRAAVRQNGIEIVHANSGATRESLCSAIAARLSRTPFIYHARVLEKGGLLERVITRLSTRIIAISGAVRDKFIKAGLAAERIDLIYNGVDLSVYNLALSGDKLKGRLSIPSSSPTVGAVGQLIPRKGYEVFLDAAELVLREVPEARFIVVGGEVPEEVAYASAIKDKAKRLGLADRVTFVGFSRDVAEYMASFDILLSTANDEPFGRVFLEAMGCGVPIVSTRVGGAAEVVGDGLAGLLIPRGDSGAAAQSVVALLRDAQKRRSIGCTGRKRAEELFSIENHCAKIVDLYRSVLGAGVISQNPDKGGD